jgi:AraC-like DNA-binding protein
MKTELAQIQMAPVATVLEPADRCEVDRAGAGLYRAVHRESVADILRDLRVRRLSAVLLSASRCRASELARATRVVREFPRVPALALLSKAGEPTPADILALGNCGVRRIVDVRTPPGWTRLRDALSTENADARETQAVADLARDLEGSPEDFVRFIEALFASRDAVRNVRSLCQALGVLPNTLMSRFYRSGLPAPKQYLAMAGLVRAARLFENPGMSIADVANHLNHSSPQSFGRHLFTYSGIPAGEFRRTYNGATMMDRFRKELITPYRDCLKSISPLIMRPRPIRPREAVH